MQSTFAAKAIFVRSHTFLQMDQTKLIFIRQCMRYWRIRLPVFYLILTPEYQQGWLKILQGNLKTFAKNYNKGGKGLSNH